MRVPAALIAIPLVAGCAAGIVTADRQPDLFPFLTASAALLAWLAAASFCADAATPECCLSLAIGAALAGVSLGADAAVRAYHPPVLRWFESLPDPARVDPVQIEGVLVEDVALTASGGALTLQISRLRQGGADLDCRRSCGGVRVTVAGAMVRDRADAWRAGRRVRMPAVLRLPAVYLNPGVADDRQALARRGIALVGSVKSAALVEGIAQGSRVDEAAADMRAWARVRLTRTIARWSERSAAIAIAILIGDRTGLSPADEDRLQRAGTYHVVAISGGNIALLAALLLILLSVPPIPPRCAAAATIAALLFYARLAGGAASVDRAVTVAVIYLAARAADRPGPPLNALAVACVLGVAVAPLAALDPGFILSFGATLAIVVGVPRLLPAPERRRSRTARALRAIVRVAAGLLAATVCADLALMPASAAMFSRVSFAGLLLNFAAVPLMAIVQGAALLVLGFADYLPRAASVCGFVAHLAAAALVDSSQVVDFLPWLARDVLPPAWWLVLVYYVSLITAVVSPRVRRAAGAIVLGSGVAIVLGLPVTSRHALPAAAPAVLRVAVLDVGQGDSTLVALPDGRVLVVDAGGIPGGGFDVGARVVLPTLRALRVRRVDTLVLTHGDPDHIGGASALLASARPRTIWEGVPVPRNEPLRGLAQAAAGIGAGWRYVQAGDVEISGGVRLTVLHPPPPEWERQRVRNEDSVVLEVRMGDVAIVLPGDIGREGERLVLPRLSRAGTVILKAPHHGSATSSTQEFVDALDPDAVIFSAGRGNRFGHPHPAVVARYRTNGTQMFGTHEDGMVMVETDGTKTEIWGWHSGRRAIFEQPSLTR